jgi:hypothetical protein
LATTSSYYKYFISYEKIRVRASDKKKKKKRKKKKNKVYSYNQTYANSLGNILVKPNGLTGSRARMFFFFNDENNIILINIFLKSNN